MNSAQTRRVIAAGVIGNVLEWYDFAIYGYFASAIGRQFFPHEDAVAQLLSVFGVFALGYLMRPVGGVLVGHIGDQFGRRAALTFSVAAMTIPTFLIGLLPGYATWGLLAPVALTLLRMVQGLSVGGEYTSSMVFLVERAPEGRRGLNGCGDLVWGGGRHPARFCNWCDFCGQHVDRGAGVLGLAHSLSAGAHWGHRRLLSAPTYARDHTGRAA
jgi:MFS family permease